MRHPILILACLLATLAACATPVARFGPDGKALPQVYKLNAADTGRLQIRMLDAVNALRQARMSIGWRMIDPGGCDARS